MSPKHALSERLASLQSWRYGLDTQITRITHALSEAGFLPADTAQQLASIQARVANERVSIGFVAEYTRGKSELINALFFGDLGRRLLPSGVGRTTRCVTELRFDRNVKTGLRLLPIETRESSLKFSELFDDESQWRTVLFDADNEDSMGRALAALSETKRISIADAVAWGLHGEALGMLEEQSRQTLNTKAVVAKTVEISKSIADKNAAVKNAIDNKSPDAESISVNATTMTSAFIDVPRWRYAVINFPHPLLDAGLVIIDTPGLAAFSTEPEAARERLLHADAMLFVLDINCGVQKPDLVLWRDHLGGHLGKTGSNQLGARNTIIDNKFDLEAETLDQARLVILNKIDELTLPDSPTMPTTNKHPDKLNDSRDLLREMDRRVRETADLLRVDPMTVIPVSARLGLAGAFESDTDKTLKSRLYQLTRSLAEQLPQTRQEAQSKAMTRTLSGLIEAAQGELDQQRYMALTGLSNLGVVRQKNKKMMSNIVDQTHAKQVRLESTFKELRGIKGVHSKLAEELAVVVDVDSATKDIQRAKAAIAASNTATTVTQNCNRYFAVTEEKLDAIELKVTEIRTLFSTIGGKMRKEFGLDDIDQFDAHPFATHRFQIELDKAREKATAEFAKSSNLLVRRGAALADQFEDVVADRVLNIFKIAQRESATWMRGLYNSLERPLGELKTQMEQRSSSVDKVKVAELDLAERIAELQAELDVIKRKHETLADARSGLERFLGQRRDQGAG